MLKRTDHMAESYAPQCKNRVELYRFIAQGHKRRKRLNINSTNGAGNWQVISNEIWRKFFPCLTYIPVVPLTPNPEPLDYINIYIWHKWYSTSIRKSKAAYFITIIIYPKFCDLLIYIQKNVFTGQTNILL